MLLFLLLSSLLGLAISGISFFNVFLLFLDQYPFNAKKKKKNNDNNSTTTCRSPRAPRRCSEGCIPPGSAGGTELHRRSIPGPPQGTHLHPRPQTWLSCPCPGLLPPQPGSPPRQCTTLHVSHAINTTCKSCMSYCPLYRVW